MVTMPYGNNLPLLTVEEEKELARRIQEGEKAQRRLSRDGLDPEKRAQLECIAQKGQEALERLIICNLRLVMEIAGRYSGRGVPFEDLCQAGTIGLMRAAKKFDPDRGYRFSTYATWWIRQTITRLLAEQGLPFAIPFYLGVLSGKVHAVYGELWGELGREPTSEEIARRIGVSTEKVERALKASAPSVSLDDPQWDNDEAELVADYIPADDDSPEEKIQRARLKERVAEVLRTLPEKERLVLELKYGLNGGNGHTLEEIGKILGVTRERVRQIELQALRRLRHPSRARRLREFWD
jgi:RNA polymerase primary sigma factor